MEHPPDPPAPESATYDPASGLFFPSEEARLFYLQGAKDALSGATSGRAHPHLPPDDPHTLTREGEATSLVSTKLFAAWDTAPPPPGAPTPRHDGWTPDRERIFLITLAETGVVSDSARAAGMSRESAAPRATPSRSAGTRRSCSPATPPPTTSPRARGTG